jgi:hypothetical protein
MFKSQSTFDASLSREWQLFAHHQSKAWKRLLRLSGYLLLYSWRAMSVILRLFLVKPQLIRHISPGHYENIEPRLPKAPQGFTGPIR